MPGLVKGNSDLLDDTGVLGQSMSASNGISVASLKKIRKSINKTRQNAFRLGRTENASMVRRLQEPKAVDQIVSD
jgi:hypothetical protein